MRSQIATGLEGNDMSNEMPLQVDQIGSTIRTIRGQKVILDTDLAGVFGVPTFRFNEAIKWNRGRFPADFLFQLTREEHEALTSQIAMSKVGRGGRRTLPYAFTENGAIMAANVLNSPETVRMSVCGAGVRLDARPAGQHQGTRAPTGRPGKETDRPAGCA